MLRGGLLAALVITIMVTMMMLVMTTMMMMMVCCQFDSQSCVTHNLVFSQLFLFIPLLNIKNKTKGL